MKKSRRRERSGTRAIEPGSSNILSHQYSPETGQMTITYRGGRSYRYSGVPQEIADGLEQSDSKGRFIHANIIDKFDHEKLPLDD